jgi:hypothetical protein
MRASLARLFGVAGTALVLAGLRPSAERVPAEHPTPSRIAGKVVDDAGLPVARARVGVVEGVVSETRLGNVTIDNCYSTTTDTDGEFEVCVPGLGVAPRPHTAWSIWARHDERGLIGAVTFTTVPPQLIVEVRLPSFVRARALDADGAPIPGLPTSVQLAEVGFTSPGPTTNGRGEVRIGPLPANLPLAISFPASLGSLALAGDWKGRAWADITLTPGETIELPAIKIGVARQTVRGTVVGENGGPVVGARVRTIIPSAFPLETLTDAQGAFALSGLLPIADDLWVLASNPVEPRYVAQRLAPTARECRLVLRPLTSARGQFANAQGQPVAGVHVYAASFLRVGPENSEDQWLLDGVPRPNEADSDAEGSWQVDGLVAGGVYALETRKPSRPMNLEPRLFEVDPGGEPIDLGPMVIP